MRTVTVVAAGPLTTVQDRGRLGFAHLGVPRAGAVDLPAATLANRLVGNDEGSAVLETTFGGLVLQVGQQLLVAVTGAPAPISVSGRPESWGRALVAPAGATVAIGRPVTGVRAYLAVSGGIAVPAVLGSRSTDTLAGVGPPTITDGTVLPVGPVHGPAPAADGVVPPAKGPVRLRLRPGPREDWFAPAALEAICSASYAVGVASNRVGLRLTGPRLDRVRAGELPSEGLVLGAVQVPPSGEPLVFLNDHPTTGGYPVIGVVERTDVYLCAQLRPGDVVRFTRR